MLRYIGLDVHATSCTLAVMTPSGQRQSWEVVATNGAALIDAVKGIRGSLHICLEEGTQSTWLYELLSPVVKEVVVVAQSERRAHVNKNDTEDAFGLAEVIRTRSFKVCRPVYKELGGVKKLRSLVKTYGFLTEDTVRSKNRLKAAYRSQGVSTAGTAVYNSELTSDWLSQLDGSILDATEMLHDSLNAMDGLKAEAEKALLKEARKQKAFAILQSVPGLGPIRAAQLLATVVTPHRFRTKRPFWKYCGLAIQTYSSNDWLPDDKGWKRKRRLMTRGLNQDHNHLLKNIFKGASMTVVQKLPDSSLHRDYQRLLKNGTKPNLAQLTIARKIAAITLAVWKKGRKYEEPTVSPNTSESVENKASQS